MLSKNVLRKIIRSFLSAAQTKWVEMSFLPHSNFVLPKHWWQAQNPQDPIVCGVFKTKCLKFEKLESGKWCSSWRFFSHYSSLHSTYSKYCVSTILPITYVSITFLIALQSHAYSKHIKVHDFSILMIQLLITSVLELSNSDKVTNSPYRFWAGLCVCVCVSVCMCLCVWGK